MRVQKAAMKAMPPRAVALFAACTLLVACGARSDLASQRDPAGDGGAGGDGGAPIGGGSPAGGAPSVICGDGVVAPDEACDVAIDATLCDPSCKGRQARELSLSSTQTLSIHPTGTPRIWGTNFFGTFNAPPVPNVLISPIDLPLSHVVDVSLQNAACVVDAEGSVFCAGPNDFGQLGMPPSGAFILEYTAVAVPASTQVVMGGQHACALGADGSVRCWGRSHVGQVDGVLEWGWLPPTLLPLTDIVELGATDQGSCARSRQGQVTCWGDDQSGLRVIDLPVAHELSGGGSSCARVAAGEVRCWGWSGGSYDPSPKEVAGATGLVRLGRSSLAHGCAVAPGGVGVCWGQNGFGELGRGAVDSAGVLEPAGPVTVVSGVGAIEAGGNSTCARLLDGRLACWGQNQYGVLGSTEGGWMSPPFLEPVFVPGFP